MVIISLLVKGSHMGYMMVDESQILVMKQTTSDLGMSDSGIQEDMKLNSFNKKKIIAVFPLGNLLDFCQLTLLVMYKLSFSVCEK